MVINHVMRLDLSEQERRVCAAYLGHDRPATRSEIKEMLNAFGAYKNTQWIDVLEQGEAQLKKWARIYGVDRDI
jgi:Mg2+ and Co2+ transporter CorA|tara:strand:- start:230 stop:451 length:222 start_codon:yes stop_codon:yes gene_type:complete